MIEKNSLLAPMHGQSATRVRTVWETPRVWLINGRAQPPSSPADMRHF